MSTTRILFILVVWSFSLFAQESLRKVLGTTLIEHFQGQIKTGYIYTKNSGQAYGFGGHIHFRTPQYCGFSAALSFETLQHFGLPHINADFYGDKQKSITFVSEAKLLYKKGDLEFEAGRFIFDSPHADSDNIRMIPNYFEGLLLHYKNFTLGHISKMAGWESGGEIGKFKPLYQVIGADQKSNGMNVIGYESDYFTFWGYNIDEIANVFYAEANLQKREFHLGLQIDKAKDSGKRIAGEIDSFTFGAIVEYSFGNLTFSGAFNKEFGTSAPMFSFGGGPFFTSMEDLTIDAVGSKNARSYTLGAEYTYSDLACGMMIGKFKGRSYNSFESDYYLRGSIGQFGIDAVYANIDHKFSNDYHIVRLIVTYNF